ncbi:hypothetical protein GG344DRAFT_66017 [Lentinula edodes]|nr:hypothetical protein GG344DRAFT_66017 [Lentinula edodes]
MYVRAMWCTMNTLRDGTKDSVGNYSLRTYPYSRRRGSHDGHWTQAPQFFLYQLSQTDFSRMTYSNLGKKREKVKSIEVIIEVLGIGMSVKIIWKLVWLKIQEHSLRKYKNKRRDYSSLQRLEEHKEDMEDERKEKNKTKRSEICMQCADPESEVAPNSHREVGFHPKLEVPTLLRLITSAITVIITAAPPPMTPPMTPLPMTLPFSPMCEFEFSDEIEGAGTENVPVVGVEEEDEEEKSGKKEVVMVVMIVIAEGRERENEEELELELIVLVACQ